MNHDIEQLTQLISGLSERIQEDFDRVNERLDLIESRLERQGSDRYWRAYEEWKKRDRDLGISIDALQRLTRDEAHERYPSR
jgi:hypothetical protein